MPKASLTPERKSQLREEVLLELDKAEIVKQPVLQKKPLAIPAVVKVKTDKISLADIAVKAEPLSAKNKITRVKPKSLARIKPILTIKKDFSPSDFMPKAKSLKLLAPATVSQLALPPKKHHKIGFLISALIIILLLLIGMLLIDIFGIYRLNWQDKMSYNVAQFLSLPAGTVDGIQIKLTDYLNDLKIVKLSSPDNQATDKDLKEKVFNRLVVNDLVSKELQKYGQSITQGDIEKEWQKISIGGDMASKIKKNYGLAISEFKEKIIKVILAKDRLQQLIVNDDSLAINQSAKKKAEDILKLASTPGIDFKTLASQYTDDPAGVGVGGDMGWITKGEISPELEQPLFATATSSVYGEPIKSRLGYHIIKTEEKLIDPESGRESIKGSQILVMVDINSYLKELMDKATIKKFIKDM